MTLEQKTVSELRRICKTKNIKGCSSRGINKNGIIKLIKKQTIIRKKTVIRKKKVKTSEECFAKAEKEYEKKRKVCQLIKEKERPKKEIEEEKPKKEMEETLTERFERVKEKNRLRREKGKKELELVYCYPNCEQEQEACLESCNDDPEIVGLKEQTIKQLRDTCKTKNIKGCYVRGIKKDEIINLIRTVFLLGENVSNKCNISCAKKYEACKNDKETYIQKIADKLNFKHGKKNLVELKDFYNSLNICDDDLKNAMFKLYNDYYSGKDIRTYTKDFLEFYNNRYSYLLDSKINAAKKRLKEKLKDPKRVKGSTTNYYSASSFNFRYPKLRRMLDSRNYTNISDFDVEKALKADPQWRNLDIVNDLIKKYIAGELTDTDVIDIQEDIQREREQFEEMKPYWEQKEREQELDWLIQQEAKYS